jgi:alpha-ribazole phosphatase
VSLLVARHASVTAKGICYGQSDVPTGLDDDAASDLLVAQLATRATPIVRVWCSPWKRARGPAERVAARLGIPLTIDLRLSELSFGDWEGQPYTKLEVDPAFQAWMATWESSAPPGGERLSDFLDRVRAWCVEALGQPQETLAVTHAGVIRALRAVARRAPYASVVVEPVGALEVERVCFTG